MCFEDIQLSPFTNIPSAPPSDCVYEQRTYRHTERFYHPTDTCRSCACTDGTVHCRRKSCPFTACSHPIKQECCQTCEGQFLKICQHTVTRTLCHLLEQKTSANLTQSFSHMRDCIYVSLPLQAAFMRAESGLMGRRGLTHQTRVRSVFAVRVLSGVTGSAVLPPTVSTRFRDSAACLVMVSDGNKNSHQLSTT